MRTPVSRTDALISFLRGTANETLLREWLRADEVTRTNTLRGMIDGGKVKVSHSPTLPESAQVLFVVWNNHTEERYLEPSPFFPSEELIAKLFIAQEFGRAKSD